MENLLKIIESMQSDHEESLLDENITIHMNDRICMIMNKKSLSHYSTKVVYAHETDQWSFQDIYKETKAYFGLKPYSWYLNVDKDKRIYDGLREKNWSVLDTYDGRFKAIEGPYPVTVSDIREVEANEKDMDDLATVIASVWQVTNEKQIHYAKEQYHKYMNLPDRRGGYVLAYIEGQAVGYGTYRFSKCGDYLYLSGTGVIEAHRKKGLYRNLLNMRLNIGLEKGAKFAVTQARHGHSSPILEQFGFNKMGEFKHLVLSKKK